METAASVAVLVTCHGTVEGVDDLPAFVRNIRHGRPAPDAVVAEVQRRFIAIGGSPLMRITEAQASALEERLGVPVRAAARLWDPYPAAVCRALIDGGARRIVSLPLAPQSVHVYHAAVERALGEVNAARHGGDGGVELVRAPAWGLEPRLIDAFVAAIAEARAALPAEARAAVVLTAHSLPARVIAAGDPYQRDFEAMAVAVRARLEPADGAAVRIAYQSQGMDGGDWLGPDLAATFVELRGLGFDALLVAPIGFVAEHVETLYDIDVEARETARALGFARLVRMPPMNTRADFIDALEAVARPLLRGQSA